MSRSLPPIPPLGAALAHTADHDAECRCWCCERLADESMTHDLRCTCEVCERFDAKLGPDVPHG